MNVSDESTVSPWATTEVAPDSAPLAQDVTVDVVVVGSGIAGMSVAYELAVAGQKWRCSIADDRKWHDGPHHRTLGSVCDDYFSELIRFARRRTSATLLPEPFDRYRAHPAIQDAESIACDFRRLDGFLFPASGKQETDLERELDAGLKLGVSGRKIRWLALCGLFRRACPSLHKSGDIPSAEVSPRTGRRHRGRGGPSLADTVVEKVEETDGGVRIATSSGFAISRKVVPSWRPIRRSMTGSPSTPSRRPIEHTLCHSRSPAVSCPTGSIGIQKTHITTFAFNPANETDFLIVGGEDHKTASPTMPRTASRL